MSFDEPTTTDDFGETPPPEESNNNKTFMIAVGILGGIILISVACLGGVFLFSQNRAATQQAEAVDVAAQTATAAQATIEVALTATFEANILPTTTLTPLPTATPPVAPQASATNTPDPASPMGLAGTQAAATATVGAAYTKAAIAQLTVYPTATVLPGSLANGGFADDYGLPGLVVMALAFVVVILFARRLRTTDTK